MVITSQPSFAALHRSLPRAALGGSDRFTLSAPKAETVGWVAGGTTVASAFGALGGLASGSLGLWGIPASALGGAILGGAAGMALTWGHHDGSVTGGMLVFGGVTGGAAALVGSLAGAALGSHPVVAGAAAAGTLALGAGIYYGFVAN